MNKKEYIKEAYKINNEYLYFDNKLAKEFCKDAEIYHAKWDKLLEKILEENGFKEILEMYEKASDYFWYS